MALGPGSRLTSAPQEDDSVFAPAVPFAIADMPKGQLDDFEGGPVDGRFILFDYGDQSQYGIQLAVRIKFKTEDGDEGEETYPCGDLRFFRPVLPAGINFPQGAYDDKTKKYYIDGLKGATAEQLEMYSSDKYLSKIMPGKPGQPPKQAIFGQNKKFGQLIAKAVTEGWPYDEALLTQSVSAFVRTMYGRWNRVTAAAKVNDATQGAVGGGLAAEAAAGAGKQNKASRTLLLTQYVPPPPAWVAQWGGSTQGVQTTPSGLMIPQGMVMPAMPPQMVMQPQLVAQPTPVAQPAGQLDQIIPMIATQAIASHMTASGGQPATVQTIAQAVMAGVKSAGGEPGPAFLMFIKPENLTRWAAAYGWVYDPAGQTLRMGG